MGFWSVPQQVPSCLGQNQWVSHSTMGWWGPHLWHASSINGLGHVLWVITWVGSFVPGSFLCRANRGFGSQTAAGPKGKPLKSRLWPLWQHLTKCSPCKHYQALSMPAPQREAAQAEERLLDDFRQSVPQNGRPQFPHYRSFFFGVNGVWRPILQCFATLSWVF